MGIRLILLILVVGLKSFSENANTTTDIKYKFFWDEKTKTASCRDAAGAEGFNPHYIGQCGDVRGLSLAGEVLNGKDLNGAILDGVNLRNARLNGASLRAVSARGAILDRAQLYGADLSYSNLSGAHMIRTYLSGANLSSTNLSGSNLAEATAHGANFIASDLSGAKININLSTAKLEKSIFSIGTELPYNKEEAKKIGMTYLSVDRTPASSGKVEAPSVKQEKK